MQQYTKIEQILHKQFLGDNPLSKYLYERILIKSKAVNHRENKNIFITGLARSGTTALLNKIYASDEVCSLTYKYMPFILSPKLANLYSKFIDNNSNKLNERYHNDGIKIGINSPECLDENFWIKSNLQKNKEFLNQINYISDEVLGGYGYLINKFSEINKDKIMIIKNNNNHIRLKPLSEYFNKSKFLVIFRDPFSHARSLLVQHINFLKLQEKNEFILEYMNLLGHNEFGKNVKPFIYTNSKNYWFREFSNQNPNYWLNQWIQTYSWILNSNLLKNKNVFLISYENLCNDKNYYKEICNICNIKNTTAGIDFKSGNKNSDIKQKDLDSLLVKQSIEINKELNNNCFKI